MKKLKTMLSASLATGALFLGTVAPIAGANIAQAETAVIVQTTPIPTDQGLAGTPNVSNNVSAGLANSSDQAVGQATDQIVNSVDGFMNKGTSDGTAGVSALVAQANTANFNSSATSGVQSLDQMGDRIIQLIKGVGGKILSIILYAVYYSSFAGIFIGLGGTVLSFFFKKMKAWKWIGTSVGSLVIYGLITNALGISLMDNPLAEAVRFIFGG